jgi:hypothetical protein
MFVFTFIFIYIYMDYRIRYCQEAPDPRAGVFNCLPKRKARWIRATAQNGF